MIFGIGAPVAMHAARLADRGNETIGGPFTLWQSIPFIVLAIVIMLVMAEFCCGAVSFVIEKLFGKQNSAKWREFWEY